MKKKAILRFGLLSADFALLCGVFLGSYWLRFTWTFLPYRPVEPFDLYVRLSVLVACFGVITLYVSRMYDFDTGFGIDQCFRIIRALTLSSLSLMIVVYALRGYISPYDTHLYSRLIIGFSWLISCLVLILWRWLFHYLLRFFLVRGRGLRRVLLLGTDETTRRLYKYMKESPFWGYYPIGCLADSDVVDSDGDIPILGDVHYLPELLKKTQVDEVILGLPHLKGELVAMMMQACHRANVTFSMVPSLFEILTNRTQTKEVNGIPIFSIDEPLLKTWNRRFKRGMDLVVGGLTLLFTAPIWIVVAVLIKLESSGAILFRQERMGKDETHFGMYKFRSMQKDAEHTKHELAQFNEVDGPIFKIREDPRMTKIGQKLRRWSIDELPQLINVLKGEMSLVGPRPYPVEESEKFDTFQRRRYEVLPGMTGLAQVNGRSDLSIDEILRLDLYYIENWSIGLDIKILLETLPAVLTRKGAY